QRAKGMTLNVEGRLAAGLDAEFIAELDVFSQSKGRTPNVFVFNPFTEVRIAHGQSFNPTKHQAQLARDLENLPQFLCRQDDIVLVSEKPSVEFLSGVKQSGFALPEFVELDNSPSSRKGGEGRLEEANCLRAQIPSPQPSPRLGGAREKNIQRGLGIAALTRRKL